MEYRDKVILITGASSGIGRALALKLAAYENKMILTGRRKKLLAKVSAEVQALGSECIYFCGDAMQNTHAEKVIKSIVEKYGRIDIAILNVGAGPASNLLTASAQSVLDCMRINYDTLIHFYAPLIRQMKLQKSQCMIAHMNSLASYFGIPMQGDYTAAKAAARIFLETVRMELKHFGFRHIQIQTIHPGFVATKEDESGNMPRPGQISADAAAEYVLRGMKSELAENRFPPTTALATRFGRMVPLWLKTKILLGLAPKRY